MTWINVSLCLPEIDVAALIQKRSIVAVTQRFILPGKSFALLPSGDLPVGAIASNWYRPEALPEVLSTRNAFSLKETTHWAQCTFCQEVDDEQAIAAIAARTIWTDAALMELWRDRDRLFLSLLQVHELSTAIPFQSAPSPEQLYKFVPLGQHLEASSDAALLSKAEFAAARTAFLEPVEDSPTATEGRLGIIEDSSAPGPKPTTSEPAIGNVLDSPDWLSKISEFGNSSDGHTFEKLVRKALCELGFRNSRDTPGASIDPGATGGAGGLDFYADQPYAIVGECKATAAPKVKDDPATQLHKLGFRHLSPHQYEKSLKLIIAAGDLTSHSNKIALGHQMNVLRPETFQALVELALKYEQAIDLSDLRACLSRPPFGVEADAQIKAMLQKRAAAVKRRSEYLRQRVQIIQTIKELSAQKIHSGRKAFTAVEIRAHHNAKYQPLVTDSAVEEMLKELSSPLSGYLSSRNLPGDQQRFRFVKDMPVQI